MTKVSEDPEVSRLLTRVFVAGVDLIWILESVYQYCLARPGEVDTVAAEARRLAAFLPAYIERLHQIAKQLQRYKVRVQSPLISGMLDLPRLIMQQARRLETQLPRMNKTPSPYRARAFWLVRVEAYLRHVSPRNHKSYATLAPLVTAGFSAFETSKIYSEDQVRQICQRFKKSFPDLALDAIEDGRGQAIAKPRIVSQLLPHLTADDILKGRRKRHV